jgi:hypothetical protein
MYKIHTGSIRAAKTTYGRGSLGIRKGRRKNIISVLESGTHFHLCGKFVSLTTSFMPPVSPDEETLNRIALSLEKLLSRQEALLNSQDLITSNHDLLSQNQVRSTHNHEIVIRNQATIIKNQGIITENQSSIMQNQALLVKNQACLQVVLELQVQLLAAQTGKPAGEISRQVNDQIDRTEQELREKLINANPRII